MSRCFPYPPPGYLLPMRRDDKGPLIESIKLQKDKEKAKEERRKERKREKKDKKRKRETHLDGGKPDIEKSQKSEKELSSLKDKYIQIHGDDESSDVTEEHNQPLCVPKPSYSSENSQNSDKRRKHDSVAPNSIKADGSVLKIRLSSFKKKEPNAIAKDEVGPSTSGRRDDPTVQNDLKFGQKFAKEELCSASVSAAGIRAPSSTPLKREDPGIRVPGSIQVEMQPSLKILDSRLSTHDVTVSKPSRSKSTSKASKGELLYKNLLESWAPPALEETDDEDQDWLFQKKPQKIERSEKSSYVPSCSLDLNLWPRAQLLPSVNIYALPYTVPF